jgi:FtsZ-interacting cell division protein ZipA
MSELQAALLVIGCGVIITVYAFGWWQQRQYRRKFGTSFESGHADALYQEGNPEPALLHKQSLSNDSDTVVTELADLATDTIGAGLPPATLLDESCSLLDHRSDYIIELHLAEPSPAVVLNGLWHRKFDFGKPVQVCGLTLAEKKWERAIAESHNLYSRFRIALQLVDRSGAVSVAKLADFRDLMLGIAKLIKADTTVPDVQEASHRALELDKFCAGVDQMVGVNLVPQDDRLIPATKIVQAAASLGMTLEADGAFHQLNEHRHSLFSLSNQNSVPFQHHTLGTFSTAGLTLLLDVPRVENPAEQFDKMMHVARELAKEFRVNVVDDRRVVLSDNGIAVIRAQIAAVETKMQEHGFKPGSAQALRLFA